MSHGNPGQCMCGRSIDGNTLEPLGDGLAFIWFCGTPTISLALWLVHNLHFTYQVFCVNIQSKWFYIIYIVINNYFYPTSVGSLQDSAQRALDSQATAHKFGELVDKHGRDNWLNPVIDELGPSIQLQVGDIANMLEVISKLVQLYLMKTFN